VAQTVRLDADLTVSLDGEGTPAWTPLAKDGLSFDARLRSTPPCPASFGSTRSTAGTSGT